MMKSVVFPVVLAFALFSGCVADAPHADSHSDEGRFQSLSEGEQYAQWDVDAFEQIGVLLDTSATSIEARVDGGQWQAVDITWDEGVHKVGRLVLDGTGRRLELRANEPWTFGTVQFFDEVEASDVLTRDLPVTEPDYNIAALAPASMVISRARWGARSPNKVCGNWHDPYRISIHHTYLPADDGRDAAARLRQIQAYHIDNRGWCDIGYHFIVSQSGKIYQGRSNEERTGAHTDNQNTGNIGISFIGNFDRQTVNPTQFAAGAKILGWAARTYGVPFNRRSIRGHREHAGQSTACPGANLQSRLEELIALARGGGGTVAPAEPSQPTQSEGPFPVAFEVNWRSDEADMYVDGSSAGTPDVFPGDWMRAEIKFTNTTSMPLRGVQIGFEMEHLVPVTYAIESDAPSFNGVSFRLNDAHNNPSNPPHNRMGQQGTLGLYALAPGETKRVTIDLNAGEYSIGAVEHGSLRAWVRHIDHHYGEQVGYDAEPSANVFDSLLQNTAKIDVIGRQEWQFDGGEAEQTEGWRGCAGADVSVDPSNGTLTTTTRAAQCVQSPAWTSIDADTWDQLVLRMNVDGNHTAAVYWARDGEAFTSSRAATFAVSPNQETYVLDLGSQPAWRGEVVRFRVVPSLDQRASAAFDAIFVQSSEGYTGSARERFVSDRTVRLSNGAPAPLNPSVDDRADGNAHVQVIVHDDESAGTSGGCSTTTSGSPSAAVLLLGFLFGMRRRRR